MSVNLDLILGLFLIKLTAFYTFMMLLFLFFQSLKVLVSFFVIVLVVLFYTFFKMSHFVLHRGKEVIQVSNDK